MGAIHHPPLFYLIRPAPDPNRRDNNRFQPGQRPSWWTNAPGDTNAFRPADFPHGTNGEPMPPPEFERGGGNRPSQPPEFASGTNRPPPPTEFASGTNRIDGRDGGRDGRRDRGQFWRPPWMSKEEYDSIKEKKGVHGLALVISLKEFKNATHRDVWLRAVIIAFAGIASAGVGLAWRAVLKSSEYQVRLVRASEQNSHLREMNVAAAGLAHETRNPLNIIRGLAQIISKAADASPETRKKSYEITTEVDRVTVQLNEFINYSKPREVRRAPVVIGAVAGDVARALQSDLEDKMIKLELPDESITVNADQQLLRQALFNLLLNAIQAVDNNGQINVVVSHSSAREVSIEVRDNGSGVPEDQRKDIFRPYFTTKDKGTGLGLAVVKQIVMAHGWEIECVANNGQGAIFRINGMELVPPARS